MPIKSCGCHQSSPAAPVEQQGPGAHGVPPCLQKRLPECGTQPAAAPAGRAQYDRAAPKTRLCLEASRGLRAWRWGSGARAPAVALLSAKGAGRGLIRSDVEARSARIIDGSTEEGNAREAGSSAATQLPSSQQWHSICFLQSGRAFDERQARSGGCPRSAEMTQNGTGAGEAYQPLFDAEQVTMAAADALAYDRQGQHLW